MIEARKAFGEAPARRSEDSVSIKAESFAKRLNAYFERYNGEEASDLDFQSGFPRQQHGIWNTSTRPACMKLSNPTGNRVRVVARAPLQGPLCQSGEYGRKKTRRHFLQAYSGVLILAVKAKPLGGAAESSLHCCGEQETALS